MTGVKYVKWLQGYISVGNTEPEPFLHAHPAGGLHELCLGFVTHSFFPELFSKSKADGFISLCTGCYTIQAKLTRQEQRHKQLSLSAPSVHPSPSSASATPHLSPPHPVLWAANSS